MDGWICQLYYMSFFSMFFFLMLEKCQEHSCSTILIVIQFVLDYGETPGLFANETYETVSVAAQRLQLAVGLTTRANPWRIKQPSFSSSTNFTAWIRVFTMLWKRNIECFANLKNGFNIHSAPSTESMFFTTMESRCDRLYFCSVKGFSEYVVWSKYNECNLFSSHKCSCSEEVNHHTLL